MSDGGSEGAEGPPSAAGSLIVVGTGFMVAGQITPEASAAMAGADRLLHLVSDSSTRMWLEDLNPDNESLYDAYDEGRPRVESYAEMIDRMLAPVRAGRRVCAAFYGHPGIYVYPSHEAIRRARAEGFSARMLPGISAEDCLYADLELDPAELGCRSYEATDFLLRRRPADRATGLLLWQVGAIGVTTYYPRAIWREAGVRLLAESLLETYPPDHEVVVYTASTLPMASPAIRRMPLAELPAAALSVASTLYVPPLEPAAPDVEAAARLGLPTARPPAAAPDALGAGADADGGGSLLSLVGTGYRVAGQVTPEAESSIRNADRLFYLVTDPTTAAWLRSLHPAAESLHDLYREGESGLAASQEMAARIVAPLEEGRSVTAAFTGHPAIALHTAHEAARRARAAGHRARMLPGVSFEDCLVADVGVDPGATGRSLWEATDFVVRPRPVDTGAALVLLQAGAIGERRYRTGTEPARAGLALLQTTLLRHYPPDHEAVVYETPQVPLAEPTVVRVPLGELADGPVRVASTLFVPPLHEWGKDPEVAARLAAGDSTRS